MGKADSRRGLTDCGWVTAGLEVEGSEKGGGCRMVVLADPTSTESIATLVEAMVFLAVQWALRGGLCHESFDKSA